MGKILDLKLKPRYDLDKQGTNPASAAQLRYLKSLGIHAPEGLSKWGASKMLDKLAKRREEGRATVRQVQDLLAGGVDADLARAMYADEAAAAIRAIQPRAPQSQGSLF